MKDGGDGSARSAASTPRTKANAAKDGVDGRQGSTVLPDRRSGATTLPCGSTDEDAAQAALDAITVKSFDTQYCVLSSADVNLGCFLTQAEAERKLQDTGQSRLLDLIGTTARLEEREVLEILQPGDPAFAVAGAHV